MLLVVSLLWGCGGFDDLSPATVRGCNPLPYNVVFEGASLLVRAIDLFVSSVVNAATGQNRWVADGLVTMNQGKCCSPIIRT